MDDRDDLDLTAIRRALEDERDALADASETTAVDRHPVSLDPQSVGRLTRMDALQVQAMAVASEARRQDRIRLIEAALERIADGEYGYCLGCDGAIPAKRLKIDPTVTRCVDCAR